MDIVIAGQYERLNNIIRVNQYYNRMSAQVLCKKIQKSPLHVTKRNNAWSNLADGSKNKSESRERKIYLCFLIVILSIYSSRDKNEAEKADELTPVKNEARVVPGKIQFSWYTAKNFKTKTSEFSLAYLSGMRITTFFRILCFLL